MATRRTKKRFTIKFELGLGGLFSVSIVVFCVFLWMFLFGVWTGQTLLEPSGAHNKDGITSFALNLWKEKAAGLVENDDLLDGLDEKSSQENGQAVQKDQLEQGGSHFSLQVAAFKDAEKARTVVLQWRARDYESFYLAPEQPNGTFYRVFVGAFAEMAEAKKMAASLHEKGRDKFFITLLPESEKRFP